MPAPLYDAHIHLADPSLTRHGDQILVDYERINFKQAVVVSTCPKDWPQILQFCKHDARLIPAIGLHPWKVNNVPLNWQAQFLDALDNGAQAIGEIGLDKWIEGYDIERQHAAFRWQLAQATKHNLPVSIHCLKAIDPLMATLRRVPLPARGFHLHAYNGAVELIPELVERGGYFSFNAGQLKVGSKKIIERIQAVPNDRLLIETDAPSCCLPRNCAPSSCPTPKQASA